MKKNLLICFVVLAAVALFSSFPSTNRQLESHEQIAQVESVTSEREASARRLALQTVALFHSEKLGSYTSLEFQPVKVSLSGDFQILGDLEDLEAKETEATFDGLPRFVASQIHRWCSDPDRDPWPSSTVSQANQSIAPPVDGELYLSTPIHHDSNGDAYIYYALNRGSSHSRQGVLRFQPDASGELQFRENTVIVLGCGIESGFTPRKTGHR